MTSERPANENERALAKDATALVEEVELVVADIWALADRAERLSFPGATVRMNIAADDLHNAVDDLRVFADAIAEGK